MTSLRRAALVGVSAAAMACATGANAQGGQPADTVDQVVVSASRITSAGFSAPTPTTVIGADLIEKSALPNVFTAVTQLPSLQGSTGTQVNNGNTSTGANGLSAFAVRGLGTTRSLTLLDGQRVVPAYNTGIVDVNQLPQLLVQRVDVVTGGASASYGSDAVGGVINFITNKRFQGFKALLQGGITTYGDDRSTNAAAAYGTSFLDGRLHLAISGEYYKNKGIPARPVGSSRGVNGRDWYQFPGTQTRTIAQTPAGEPQNINVTNAQNNQYSAGGLITLGPLQGITFGPGGVPSMFQYGSSGVPNRTAAGGVQGCIGVTCIGGDQSGNVAFTNTLDGPIDRKVFYTRLGYDLGEHTELYTTFSYADVYNFNQPNGGAAKASNLTIQCDNAYLPQSIKDACVANRITNFRYGVTNQIFPEYIKVNSYRKQARFVLGLDSDLNIFGKTWNLSSYAQHGETVADIDIDDITINARYNEAIDAVVGANGVIQCRSAIARSAGCVPLNVIGLNPVSEAAFRYIAPTVGPKQHTFLRQETVSFVLNGTPFRNWAGEVSIATGAEWREEFYKVRGDPYGNGVAADSPNTPDYPFDPLLNNTQGNNWYAGNFHHGGGRYDVKEAFLEAGIPLFADSPLGTADLNLGGRITDYSTSGVVKTWKIGGVWDTPIDGLRLRSVRSRDVRAPNLSELFAAPIIMNGTVTDRTTNIGILHLDTAIGNPDLKPEVSNGLEVGAVLRPSWIPRLNLSVDYYRVKLTGAIQSLGGQQTVDLCQVNGNTEYCSFFFLGGSPGTATPSYVIRKPINLARINTDGLNLEASYQFGLDRFGIPGEFTARALASRVFNFTTDTGVPGSFPSETAGVNTGATPKWKVFATQSWTLDKLTLNLTERGISKGRTTVNSIECQKPSCPVPTVETGTVANSRIPSALYWDIGASYDLRDDISIFAKVDNLFDLDPPWNSSVTLYDNIGRTFRVGIRINR